MARPTMKVVLTIAVLATIAGAIVLTAVIHDGFSARNKPGAIETAIARRLRRIAMPVGARGAKNPVAATPAALAEARAHFADHCATCHANDGSGNTEIGEHLYPPAPDMRK